MVHVLGERLVAFDHKTHRSASPYESMVEMHSVISSSTSRSTPHRIQRGEHGHIVFHRAAANLRAVAVAAQVGRLAGVDDVVDVSLPEGIEDLLAALAELLADAGADAVGLEELGGSARGLDVEAHVIEAAD